MSRASLVVSPARPPAGAGTAAEASPTSAPWTQGFDFSERVAVVTGAASGIGLAAARLLSRCGARLALLDLRPEVAGVARELEGGLDRHLACQVDLGAPAAIAEAIRQVHDRFGAIDILVNNAGVALLDKAENLSEAAWDATMAINLKAPFLLAQAVGRGMRQVGHGRIVNLASQASVVALDRHAAYCASKAALVGLTQVLALEWAPHGITVNAISPTVVDTELGRTAWVGEAGAAMRARIPVGRFARPDEVAGLILFLASDASAMVTGANIMIDGGYTAQ